MAPEADVVRGGTDVSSHFLAGVTAHALASQHAEGPDHAVTVPSRPTMGAMEPMVLSKLIQV